MAQTTENVGSVHQQPRKRYQTPTLRSYGDIQKITQTSNPNHGTKDEPTDKTKSIL